MQKFTGYGPWYSMPAFTVMRMQNLSLWYLPSLSLSEEILLFGWASRDCYIMLSLPCLNNQLVSESDVGASINRRTVKHLSPSLRMMSLLMNTANPWKRMEHGLDIWNCKQLLLLHIVIYAFIGWDLLSLPLACLILSCIREFW